MAYTCRRHYANDYFITLAKIVSLKVIVIKCLKACARDLLYVFVFVYSFCME